MTGHTCSEHLTERQISSGNDGRPYRIVALFCSICGCQVGSSWKVY